jgi:PQQ-like domain
MTDSLFRAPRCHSTVCSLVLLSIGQACLAQVSVLTYHNDNARTGQNLSEKILTPQNVNFRSFGKLRSLPVDGKVDAQPLVVSGLTIGGKTGRNVVFVATDHDGLYAFDADTGVNYWKRSLLLAKETPSDSRRCSQVVPVIGITSTPVISKSVGPHGALYAVAMSKDASGHYHQRLHAIDLALGSEMFGGPVEISASYPGTGDNSSGGVVRFDPKQYKERPGLLLLNGVVYTSWSSHCDIPPYTGWAIGYSATTLKRTSVFNFAPNGSDASIWASGAAPAADAAGNLYFSVANGTFDTTLNSSGFPSRGDYGNTFVKLALVNGALKPVDYWTMHDTVAQSARDEDLGSGGIMLLPDVADSAGHTRHLALGGGKDHHIYVVDRDHMGKFNPNSNANIYQELPSSLGGQVFSTPAVYGGKVYIGGVDDVIRAFKITAARLSAKSVTNTPNLFPYPGATPSISANGSQNAILWAAENSNPAVLHAYDARDISIELYNSNQAANGRDHFGAGNKFIVPTIANGKVFVGTTNSVGVFGLLK